jgi:ABC-type multidrug transport system ATPase subunit
MTSWESLSFYAGLVLPANTSADKKRKRIQDVLSMMGLAHARDTLVRRGAGGRVEAAAARRRGTHTAA